MKKIKTLLGSWESMMMKTRIKKWRSEKFDVGVRKKGSFLMVGRESVAIEANIRV